MKPAELNAAAALRVDRLSAADLARARQVLADETASVADLPTPVVETFRSLLEHFERGQDVVLELGPDYLTVEEAARVMGVDTSTVDRLIQVGQFNTTSENSSIRIFRDSVMNWIRGHQILQEMRRVGYEGQSIDD